MRWEFLGAIVVLASGAWSALAQPGTLKEAPAGLPSADPAVSAAQPPHVPDLGSEPCAPPCPPRVWASGEYLLWWIKEGPLPVPLVSFGDANDAFPGALGQPGTQVLYGGTPVDYGSFSGMRLTLGGWLNNSGTVGLEGRAFLLERRSTQFQVSSNGNPVLAIPVIDHDPLIDPPPPPPGQEGFQFAFPDVSTGAIAVLTTTRLWGAEVNGILSGARRNGMSTDFLLGFRYVDLDEHLRIFTHSDLDLPPFRATSNGIDHFGTRNQFYGGQLGARIGWRGNRLSADVLGKVALGFTHQALTISGFTNITGTPVPPFSAGLFPGDVFTEPTNIGRYHRDSFAVIPEVEVRAGYRFTSQLTASVGYNFLYWDDVLRPGEQINRVLNGSQRFGFPLLGPVQPVPIIRSSDFWAHGVNFGLEFKY